MAKTNNSQNLIITTIACYDKKEYVERFMADNRYSYPVLLSDGQLQKKFDISKYPIKLLLLPNGVQLVIPYREDYRALIDSYLKWEI